MSRSESLRKAYGKALVRMGEKDSRIVALDADLGKSTFSRDMLNLDKDRFIEVGIAEQNMASISAGLSFTGKIPFYSTFAVFSTGRAYDQIRSSICIPNLNVNICGSSAGLSDYGDGKTHQSVDDIALMQVLPNMTVFSPADANQVGGMVEAMAQYEGPSYIRIPRNDLPVITEPGSYSIGQVDIFHEGEDIAIIATGSTVHTALEAAGSLENEGISVKVAGIGTIKPFPAEKVREIASSVKGVVIIEEHNIIGGLASAVYPALTGLSVPIEQLGVQDTFGQSSESYELLVDLYGLSASEVERRCRKLLK